MPRPIQWQRATHTLKFPEEAMYVSNPKLTSAMPVPDIQDNLRQEELNCRRYQMYPA